MLKCLSLCKNICENNKVLYLAHIFVKTNMEKVLKPVSNAASVSDTYVYRTHPVKYLKS
jgi:hypothetical protein